MSPNRSHRFAGVALQPLLLAAALHGNPAAAQGQSELGRLFYTPEQRQALDRQRRAPAEDAHDAAVNPALTVNGVVTRRDGRHTVWINDAPQDEKSTPRGGPVTPDRRTPGKVVVKTEEARTVRLKVGDTLYRESGERDDLLNGGKITIKSPP